MPSFPQITNQKYLAIYSGNLVWKIRKWTFHKQKSGILVSQNQKSEIKNQKSEIRNQKSEIRNQKSEIRNQKSGIRNQKSEIRNQKSEIRNQRKKSLSYYQSAAKKIPKKGNNWKWRHRNPTPPPPLPSPFIQDKIVGYKALWVCPSLHVLSLISDFWFLISDSWFLISDFWFLILGN